MHISKSKLNAKWNYTQALFVVQQATRLGVELLSNLSWTPQINEITSKASQDFGFLKRNLHSANSSLQIYRKTLLTI